MNPFNTSAMPVDRLDDLLYRDSKIQEIRKQVDQRAQTAIFGVEGSGKTSLLNCAFDRNYRIEKAKEGVLISHVTEFPSNLMSDGIYMHFAGMITDSVNILSQCGKAEEMKTIKERCKEIREEVNSSEDYYERIVTSIHNDYGYHIVMVVDNFERFTSSCEVTIKHHETLRKLLNYSQYIVATNYDLTEDSLPPDVSASLLLMTFGLNKLSVNGWSYEQTSMFIENKLKNSDIVFSDKLIKIIYEVSGGIPFILNLVANYAYDYILNNHTEDNLKFNPTLYNAEIVQTLLFRWCKMINPLQITALRHLCEGNYNDEVDLTKLRNLYLRGVLNKKTSIDTNGNTIIHDNEYEFCCKFLGTFCTDTGKLELAASENPLNIPPDDTEKPEEQDRTPPGDSSDMMNVHRRNRLRRR